MIRHIVAWNHKDGFTEAEKKENAEKNKNRVRSADPMHGWNH